MKLTEEIEHKLGTHQTLCSVQSKEAERQELERHVKEFLTAGGKIKKAKPEEWTPDATSFNREGPINPAKFEGRWDNHNIAKNYRV